MVNLFEISNYVGKNQSVKCIWWELYLKNTTRVASRVASRVMR